MAGKLHKAETVFVTWGENLSLPVDAQCFAAMDGSKSLNVPWMGRLRCTRHFERI